MLQKQNIASVWLKICNSASYVNYEWTWKEQRKISCFDLAILQHARQRKIEIEEGMIRFCYVITMVHTTWDDHFQILVSKLSAYQYIMRLSKINDCNNSFRKNFLRPNEGKVC